MITINKELSGKIVKLEEVRSYISVVVDYKKEEEYINLQNDITKELETISDNFTPKDIDAIINIIDEPQTYYLYNTDDIIETLFPLEVGKSVFVKSAYYWIEEKNRIEWIVNNVLCDNKYYNIIDNVNDNYIIATEQLKAI